MLKSGKVGLALGLLAALSACSLFEQGPRKEAPPASSYEPVPSAEPPALPADASGGTGQLGANSGGTYPYGSAQPSGTAAARSGDDIVLRDPDGGLWRKANANEAGYRDDISQCYKYANAQMRHDEMIITDQNAAFDGLTASPAFGRIQSKVQNYDLNKQRKRLIGSCMKSKGYLRQ